jgi:hypothetical protein
MQGCKQDLSGCIMAVTYRGGGGGPTNSVEDRQNGDLF